MKTHELMLGGQVPVRVGQAIFHEGKLWLLKEIITPRPKLVDGKITVSLLQDGVEHKTSCIKTAINLGCIWKVLS